MDVLNGTEVYHILYYTNNIMIDFNYLNGKNPKFVFYRGIRNFINHLVYENITKHDISYRKLSEEEKKDVICLGDDINQYDIEYLIDNTMKHLYEISYEISLFMKDECLSEEEFNMSEEGKISVYDSIFSALQRLSDDFTQILLDKETFYS